VKKIKKITLFGLIGLIVAFFISFGGFSCSSTSKDSSSSDYPYQVTLAPELEGKIEARYNWNSEHNLEYEYKRLWVVVEIKNISEWPLTAVAIQYSYKDETTGGVFFSSMRPKAKDPPKYWIQPGQKDIFTPGEELFGKDGGKSGKWSGEKYYHEWSIQKVFIRSARFYKGPPLSIAELEEFENTISQLNTPQKLIDYLNQNFEMEEGDNGEAYPPQEFFKKKKGDIRDFAVFTSYVLAKNKITDPDSIEVYKYIEKETGKEGINVTVTIGKMYDYPFLTTIFFSPNGIGLYNRDDTKDYWTELIQREEKRLNVEIREIGGFFWQSPKLEEDGNWYKVVKINEDYYQLEPLTEVPPE